MRRGCAGSGSCPSPRCSGATGSRSCSRSRRPSPCRSSTRACGSGPRRPGACAPAGGRGRASLLLLAAASVGDVVVGRAAAEVLVACSRSCRNELALATLAAALTAAAEELNAVGDDLDRLALAAVLRFPLAPVEPASTPTGRPFERYCAQLSPWFPQTVTSK